MNASPVSRPPLDAGTLAAAGPGLLPGLRIEVVEEAGSTNALVAERATAGEPEGLVVVAEHQVAGRGRLDRTWESPARSALTFSLLLRPTVPARAWPWLPLLTGYAVGKALRAAGFDASVKWPNDVLLTRRDGESRKVAGILVERIETPSGPAAVVGIGLNVGMTAEELPVETATSLALEGDPPERTQLLLALLAALGEAYAAWQEGGEEAADRLRQSYAAACATIGRPVRVELPTGTLEGRAVGVDESGRLLVESPGQPGAIGGATGGATGARTVPVSAGDVVHVRTRLE